ncbi:protein TIC110, chloroplastic-like [Magnolia sinica]|uniref:protein TIC110, chloroplastic-like n=1 Tax=Magnolia sinica TaxID=86752 RepID=UPI00265AA9D7|nr:protein TIC110, chloroplastic-like [Magnolia sinica]
MDLPLLLFSPSVPSPSPSPSLSRRLLISQFNSNPLRFKNPRKSFLTRNPSPKIAVVRNSVSEAIEPDNSVNSAIFGGKKQLPGPQALIDGLSPPVRLATSAVFVAGALAAGYGLGFRFGGTRATGLGGAVALGAAGGAAVYAMNACVPEVAAVSLHNYVVGSDDPGTLKREDVEEIAQRYGVSKQDEAFNAELCDLYSRFVSSILPPGHENLKGNEVETILKFKNALGIDDPDAAAVHMEIGRRIFRQRLETGDRDADIEQRRAFQKLVYVSTLVFGEASTFLLPWKRVFKVTDSQVEVAIRDNAQRLYAMKLNLVNRDIDEKTLISLREAQLLYRLSDEVAADMFREQTRKLVEENISTALDMLKSRTRVRETAPVVEELDQILAFNNSLISLSSHPEASRFAPGVGPVSLIGGEYDSDRKMDDLKLLYRAYLADSFSSGRIEEDKLVALNHLKNVFGLGKREAETIMLEVTSKVYRKRLSQVVSSGDLEAATSKAAFLQNLCDELHFDPQKASEIHEEIYRQKLQQSVADGELSDEDVAVLLRLRVMLCIPQETVDAAHADVCGRLFEKVVKDAIAAGVEGYDADVRASVRKASKGLRLKRDAAMTIASKAVRMMFMNYIKRSRAAGSRIEAAKELKKMIAFNTLVVTELIADIKGESTVTTSKPIDVEPEKTEEDEWESLQTLRKTRPSKELEAKLGRPGQTEITLKDDLPERERTDLYRTYLLFCLQGEVTVVPFGAQITTKKDNSEYLLLNQLGGILGLTGKEIVDVHRSLAEQAFKQQAQVILADGQITKARMEQLNEVQKQVGLPAEAAQQVIKSITTSKLQATIETAVSQGRMSAKQIRELKEVGVDVSGMISERLREEIFKKTVTEFFSSGTGEFDEAEIYERIPSDLSINVEKVRGVVHELAKNRISESLVQAVALLRQRKPAEVVSSLNDMLACDKAVPSEPLSWQVPEELVDLFLVYMKNDPPSQKLSRLQYLLGVSHSTLEELQKRLEKGGLANGDEEEAFVF